MGEESILSINSITRNAQFHLLLAYVTANLLLRKLLTFEMHSLVSTARRRQSWRTWTSTKLFTNYALANTTVGPDACGFAR